MLKKLPDNLITALAGLAWTMVAFLSSGEVVIGDYKFAIPLQIRVLIFVVGVAAFMAARYYWQRYKQANPKRFDRNFARSLRALASHLKEGARDDVSAEIITARIAEFRAISREFDGNKDICVYIEKLDAASRAHVAKGFTNVDTAKAVVDAANELLEYTNWVSEEPKR